MATHIAMASRLDCGLVWVPSVTSQSGKNPNCLIQVTLEGTLGDIISIVLFIASNIYRIRFGAHTHTDTNTLVHTYIHTCMQTNIHTSIRVREGARAVMIKEMRERGTVREGAVVIRESRERHCKRGCVLW